MLPAGPFTVVSRRVHRIPYRNIHAWSQHWTPKTSRKELRTTNLLRFGQRTQTCGLTNRKFPSSAPINQRIRLASSATLPARPSYAHRFIYRFFAFTGGFILVVGGLVLAFFVYDASTYREDLTFTDISVAEEALSPRIGGPKNLPIADSLVDDDESPGNTRSKNKPKLVVLGSGWGSVALLKQLNLDNYHVTVVSPVNYFLFTPMLPSGTVGTLELRSLVEPIRRIVQRVQGHFLRAEAVDVELSERLLEVAQTDASGRKRHFYLPYDKLVIGVGKLNNTSCSLCSIAHARRRDYEPPWRKRPREL